MGCGPSSPPSNSTNNHNTNTNRAVGNLSEEKDRDEAEAERRRWLEEEQDRREEEYRKRREEEAVYNKELNETKDEKELPNAEENERKRLQEEEERKRLQEEEERKRLQEEEEKRKKEEEERLRAEEEKKIVEEKENHKDDVPAEEKEKTDEEEAPAEDKKEVDKGEADTLKAVIDEEDETPFDDDGFRDSEGYSMTPMSLMVKSMDFRELYTDSEVEPRPQVQPGELYKDEDFPVDIALVEDHGNVEWKRPGEFIDNPQLFTDGTTRFDIGQGSAGTCWFLSTVANIAENDDMLKQVIPSGAYLIDKPDEYDGVFHAKFFRFGRWEDVYIDDCLPVIYGKVLWGAKSVTDDREMWVALLEKAFARLYGSYDAIYGGQPGDAYLLLTGGIGERIDLEEHSDKAKRLYRRISNATKSGCQVACVVPDEFNDHFGLVGGHAYSLVGTEKVNGVKLVRVRNPWGHGEWKGPWSDGSAEWESITDPAVKAPNRDDGEFFVSLDDFMSYFSQTTICSLTPDMDLDGTADSLKHILSIYGEWSPGASGGFKNMLNNPRFCFTLSDEGVKKNGLVPFVMQIIQQSEKRKTDNISMRCDVFRITGDSIKPVRRFIAAEIQGVKNNVYTPELQTAFRHWLKPGKYLVIPSTVDPGLEKAFLIRLFTSHPLTNVTQIPQECRLTSCEYEATMKEANGKEFDLTFEKTLFGEFQSGRNAGGQVSNMESYHKNPQYCVVVPDTGSAVPLVIHIMQDQVEPQYPVGIRFFKLESHTRVPVDIKWLYDNYNESPYHEEDSQSKFMISWDVDVRYLLPAGRYVAVIHLDEPNTEKEFAILFKSNTRLAIKGHQT